MTPDVFAIIDDSAVRESTTSLIRCRSANWRVYASSAEFLASYDGRIGGCLLIDIYAPSQCGIDIMKQLTLAGATLPAIMGTARRDVKFAVMAMRNGAVSCLERPYDMQALWSSIQEAIKISEMSVEHGHHRFEALRRMATLTPNERQVLDELMLGKCNKSIAKSLDLGLRTVELRRSRILQKTRVRSLPELVQIVMVANGHASHRFVGNRPTPVVLDVLTEAIPPGVIVH